MNEISTNPSGLVALQRDARIPLHRQIETSIRDAIRAGRLPRGSSLPPSRVLAADLGVSRGVVVEAYQQLSSEGYLASYAGGYTQVAAGPAPAAAGLRLARETPPRIDLSYGRADVSSFPRAAWLRAIRGALAMFRNDPVTWRRIQTNGMAKDFSWQASAIEYARLYEVAWKARIRKAATTSN